MLDFDLAELYEVETRALKQSVKRNINRFPDDFMFQLNKGEWRELITNCDNLPTKYRHLPVTPNAFTELGVAMLSSVLNSERAIAVNIQIIRIFTRMRQLMLTHKDILLKLEKLERGFESHDEKIKLIFEYLRQLLTHPTKERKQIGFKQNHK